MLKAGYEAHPADIGDAIAQVLDARGTLDYSQTYRMSPINLRDPDTQTIFEIIVWTTMLASLVATLLVASAVFHTTVLFHEMIGHWQVMLCVGIVWFVCSALTLSRGWGIDWPIKPQVMLLLLLVAVQGVIIGFMLTAAFHHMILFAAVTFTALVATKFVLAFIPYRCLQISGIFRTWKVACGGCCCRPQHHSVDIPAPGNGHVPHKTDPIPGPKTREFAVVWYATNTSAVLHLVISGVLLLYIAVLLVREMIQVPFEETTTELVRDDGWVIYESETTLDWLHRPQPYWKFLVAVAMGVVQFMCILVLYHDHVRRAMACQCMHVATQMYMSAVFGWQLLLVAFMLEKVKRCCVTCRLRTV